MSPGEFRKAQNVKLEAIRNDALLAGDDLLAGMLTIVMNSGAADAPPNFQAEMYQLMFEKWRDGARKLGRNI